MLNFALYYTWVIAKFASSITLPVFLLFYFIKIAMDNINENKAESNLENIRQVKENEDLEMSTGTTILESQNSALKKILEKLTNEKEKKTSKLY
jgi:hypothetical protein